jgi:predicted GNAT family acetyltransferase
VAVTTMQQELATSLATGSVVPVESLRTQRLGQTDEAEVLEFLSIRPIHTVFMVSLIRDNGMVSSSNRGSFIGCRNESGRLEGVGLIGHATIIETESEECIKAFAQLAKNHSPAHLIRGEEEKVESFWRYYAEGDQAPRLLCRELLLERSSAPVNCPAVPELRLATLDELEQVMKLNAAMAFAESGIDPLTRDPHGFRERSACRISRGRNWICTENGRVIFKTDIIAETPAVIYLEGVYVDPEYREKGYGLRCLSQLTRLLLARSEHICLTVNEKFSGTQAFYNRAGYKVCSRYDTIYLEK